MSVDLNALLSALESSPEDWETRSTVAQHQYESEQYVEAAQTILEAPEIPGDEDNVIFASTIVASADTEQAHGLLDSFLAENESAQAHYLKSQIFEAEEDSENAQASLAAAIALDPSLAEGGEQEAVAVAEVVEEEEEVVEAVAAPVPLSPRKLQPPGSKEEESEAEEVALAAPAAAAAVAPELTVTAPQELAADRAFIVAEGEAVHAADKESDSKEKVSAITVAVLVHVLIAVLFGLVAMSKPRPNPPQISVSAVANTDDSSMENQTVTRMQQRSASAQATAQPVISSTAFSNLAMPDVIDVSADLSMVSMADSDVGFGMSMSGFGDVSNMGAIPASMRSRCSMSQRMQRLRESGGQDRAEKSVRNGLEWISKQQNEDGSFGKHGDEKTKSGLYAANTGLALLAYLGHCETPESPKFGNSVVSAAQFLMSTGKKNDGYFCTSKKGYAHGIATYALAELYTMTNESGRPVPGLESVLKKAAKLIVDGQTGTPSKADRGEEKPGGWDYEYRQSNNPDLSVSGWNIQALKALHNTGRDFRGVDEALERAHQYLDDDQDAEGAFKYRMDNARGKRSLTGAALLGLQVWNQKDSEQYKMGIAYLDTMVSANPPLDPKSYYEPYYNTQAMFIHEGEEWAKYNKNFQTKLLDKQNADGSWTGANAESHGYPMHFMNTAWAVLMLEVYYRYLPTTDKVEGLKAR